MAASEGEGEAGEQEEAAAEGARGEERMESKRAREGLVSHG